MYGLSVFYMTCIVVLNVVCKNLEARFALDFVRRKLCSSVRHRYLNPASQYVFHQQHHSSLEHVLYIYAEVISKSDVMRYGMWFVMTSLFPISYSYLPISFKHISDSDHAHVTALLCL